MNPQGVLSYLLTWVRYRRDDPRFSLRDAFDFGLPTKPRYRIRDGDYTDNEYSGTRGYYLNEKTGKYIAFDNSANECFVEEFDTPELAESWLKGEFETT